MLTSKTDEESVVKGLENGATDYVKKPFSNRELLARIRVVLREKKAKDTITVYGPIRVNQEKREIVIDGKELKLDRRQYDILQLFVVNAERVLTRERIIENLDAGEEISDRTIDSHVSHIRKIFRQHKVEEIKISSIYGVGYRLEQK